MLENTESSDNEIPPIYLVTLAFEKMLLKNDFVINVDFQTPFFQIIPIRSPCLHS
jgi:hypothetical protein